MFFADEMRVGLIGVRLIGQVRRRWAPRGVKLRQAAGVYVRVVIPEPGRESGGGNAPVEGTLRWAWTPNMKAASIAPVIKAWEGEMEAVVWDGARGHAGLAYETVGVKRIQQPPYAPELQPAERVFGYLRSRVEGIVYGKLSAKRAAVEKELRKLASCPDAVRSLTGWDWIRRSLAQAGCT